jgi:hypothetical protein
VIALPARFARDVSAFATRATSDGAADDGGAR